MTDELIEFAVQYVLYPIVFGLAIGTGLELLGAAWRLL